MGRTNMHLIFMSMFLMKVEISAMIAVGTESIIKNMDLAL